MALTLPLGLQGAQVAIDVENCCSVKLVFLCLCLKMCYVYIVYTRTLDGNDLNIFTYFQISKTPVQMDTNKRMLDEIPTVNES